MKLLLLHGPAINSSRKKLLEVKEKFAENNVVIFDPSVNLSQGLDNIEAMLMTIPLLSEERLVILENPPEDFTPLTLESSDLTLVFWFDHEVSATKPLMQWIKQQNGEALFFPEEKEASIFPLLDSLGSRDKRAFLELAKRNKTSPNDTQYILTMVFYLLRSLVCTPKSAGDFMKKKNERMRKNFEAGGLVSLYKSILEIDFKIKSGLLENPQAQFLLVNLFTHQA